MMRNDHGGRFGASRGFARAAVLSLVVVGSVDAQVPEPSAAIRVSPPVLLFATHPGRPAVEPHVAVHPGDPDHLLAAAIVAAPAADFAEFRARLSCASFLSRDGGRTWRRQDLPVTTCYDPWVVFATDGTALLSVLANHPAHPNVREPLLVFRSHDGGETWDDVPVSLGANHDRPMMVADASHPDRAGWVYLVSSRTIRAEHGESREAVYVARSREGGRSFDEPRLLTPNNLVLRAEAPAVRADGTLVVHYVEAAHATAGPRPQELLVRRRAFTATSSDGGITFAAPRFITEACGPPRFAPASLVAHGSRSAATPPADAAATLPADAAAALPADAAAERLTHLCNAAGGGAVLATTSVPGTELWTEPRPIHAPLAAGATAHVRAAAADRDGTIGVLFSTRVAHGERRCFEVHFTASVDGGATFLSPRALFDEPSCPDPTQNGAAVNGWPDGGDYYGIAADGTGGFQLVWPDARAGVFRIYSARAELGRAR